MAEEHELVLEELVKTYGSVTAVDRVSLAVRPGEFVTLLGPSGSGKTTTLMMIAGFVYPTSGRVFFRGENITYMPAHLRNVGMVFQNYALFPHMSVSANVAFPLRMRKVPAREIRERVLAALALVHMAGYEERMPAQLSGGQQQRIALARALVFEPAFLLMDEPLGALDRYLRERMQLEIKAIQVATGVTIVYVTHDQQEALVLSDRIIVMDRGWIRMEGSAVDVYERPVDSFVAQFIGETNLLRGRVVASSPRGRVVRLGPGLEVRLAKVAGGNEAADDAVRAAGGPRAGPGQRSEASSSEVAFCVRPERISCPASEAPGTIALVARVAEVTYLGDIVKYRVILEGSAPEVSLVAKLLAGSGRPAVAVGDRVTIGWRPEDAWVLPGSQDSTGTHDSE